MKILTYPYTIYFILIQQLIDLSMEVTTKEMTMTKMSLINLMTNLFLQCPKTTVCRLFKEVFMHYLSIKMP